MIWLQNSDQYIIHLIIAMIGAIDTTIQVHVYTYYSVFKIVSLGYLHIWLQNSDQYIIHIIIAMIGAIDTTIQVHVYTVCTYYSVF